MIGRRLLALLAGGLVPALAAAAIATGAVPASGQDRRLPDAALAQLLQEARAPGGCDRPDADRLVRVLCAGSIRIGVRENYPLFSTRDGDVRQGYEVDVGHAIAAKLGLAIEFARLNAANRIPLLGEDRVDLVIATMGHNTQRDGQVRFIRPHYYRSETVLVGPRALAIQGWQDIPGRTVCVTIGNGSNADLVSHGARLMLFDEAGVLPDRLNDETCTFAAQDDSFFAEAFTRDSFARQFAEKFGFAQVPWGMAVARRGADGLARALDLTSQIFHRDGVFVELARKNRIGTTFLEEQQRVWQRPECNNDAGVSNGECILPALNADLQPTGFAAGVADFERDFFALTGIEFVLPMLKTAPAFSMLLSGIGNTLILIVGALGATLLFSMGFGAALGSPFRFVRWLAKAVVVTMQSSPIVLTLVVASAFAHALFPYSPAVALGAAIVALGLANGSNAGQAIGEAIFTVRAEHAAKGLGEQGIFTHALGRSATQIMAFLINAAKGTPVASFIGAPELLSALTDITSFSSGRATTYTLLLIFYTAVVMVVIALCRRLQHLLERRRLAT
jgi:polar amino acid transport system substrate-binding protein